jgi:hypothetical protein
MRHNLLPANYVITIAPENHQLSRPVHSNIRITGNRFICYTPAVLTARSVDGLDFLRQQHRTGTVFPG